VRAGLCSSYLRRNEGGRKVPEDQLAARTSEGRINGRTVILLFVVNGLLLALGLGSTFWSIGTDIGISGVAFSTAAVGLWTFLVFFKDSEDIRTAVTASFLALYLAFVAASFNKDVNAAFVDGSLLKAVWDSLNPLMIAIIGFYFGGKAFEKSASSRSGGAQGQPGDEPS
jgi:hypothetical protein